MAYAAWSVVAGEQPTAAKWNILGTNDSSFNDGTGIGTSAITPEKLLAGNGTTWPWQTWTITWTASSGSVAIGNGTLVGAYALIGKLCAFRIKFIAGSTTTFGSGTWYWNFPVTPNAAIILNYGFVVMGYAEDAGVSGWSLQGGRALDNTKMQFGSSSAASVFSTTGPFTWANGDFFSAHGFFEAA